MQIQAQSQLVDFALAHCSPWEFAETGRSDRFRIERSSLAFEVVKNHFPKPTPALYQEPQKPGSYTKLAFVPSGLDDSSPLSDDRLLVTTPRSLLGEEPQGLSCVLMGSSHRS